DAESNNHMSILNNPCMTAGGDMIADDDNNLYLIAARGYVYRISVRDMLATYLGEIKGLPKEFSANGAAVNHEGKIVVTSSVFKNAIYQVDPVSWEATQLVSKSGAFNAADLGSSNLLVTNKAKAGPAFVNNIKGTVKIYPNPVRTGNFKVNFTNMEAGDYYLDLTDVSGRRVMQKKINISSGTYVETINLPGSFTKGIYMMKLMNSQTKQISVQKVLVERSK
ncbi:MAG TPA: T9SS type A sorting domain-containing protein, partial [Chitinophagaceae bacterium]|nr:T9SS type A sorting domain-containing protein [Chitinophagaceae bacterium]